MSNVPALVFGPNGVVLPAETDILTGVLTDLQESFGGEVLDIVNLETPQGQIAQTSTRIIGDKNNQFAWFMAMVDPATSQGRMQDAIARIYFIERDPAISTVVPVVCNGAEKTVIPQGALVQARDGNLYYAVDGGVIPSSGLITLQFACQTTGPITCPAGNIYRPNSIITGWDSVTNLVDGVEGRDVESAFQFEQRRQQTVAINSRGSNDSIKSVVFSISGVLDVFVTDNRKRIPATIQGVTLAPHSLYVCVIGGDDDLVGQAIINRCSAGCDFNGSTTVTVYDQTYTEPRPSYQVSFQRPTPVTGYMAVVLQNSTLVPSDATAQIKAAVLYAFAGSDGGPRVRIGGYLFASRFYAAVQSLGTWAQNISIQVGTSFPANSSYVSSNIDQIITLTENNITVSLV